ncbi:MAG: chromosome segregation protein SMC [Clostridium sp.]|nr:chromosome segregation protein SMC [Clostridium sp.]
MFLKSLEIRGFKSFADKTELRFKKGVTAVVGPNGSGKSNISDSVRWVLGEQSVKTLRGGKMEDVIFAGTQYRKPVGLAQVSLTLDNEDGSLSTEYNEVTVTRRIFRSGETEYLLNGTKCRLKDITQLFMDTGIGKEGYSLIGQGKIEAVLSGKPEERRNLLEEAAGIVKYKSRKEEAEKKLSNTDNNLVRIKDIISTYEERLEPLKIERDKALKYRDLADELKEKEVSLSVFYISEIEKILESFEKDLEIKEKSLTDKRDKLNKEKEIVARLKNKIDEIEKKTDLNKKTYYLSKEKISNYTNDIKLIEERIKNLNINIEKNDIEVSNLKNKISDLNSKKIILEKELEKSKEEQVQRENEIRNLEKTSNNYSVKLNEIEENIKRIKDNQFEILKGHTDINNAILLTKNDIKTKTLRIEELKKTFNNVESNIKINLATIEGIAQTIENSKSQEKLLELGISDKKKKITSINIKASKVDENIRRLNKSLNELEANKTMLENLEKHLEGYNRTVKILMENIKNGKAPKADGTKVLGEILTISKEYEIAIETALGAALSNVITENDIIAKNLINYLKQNRIGRATFLPLNNIKGNVLNLDSKITSIDGFIGIASQIVSYPEKYKIAVNNVLGRTIVARDMDCALVISKVSGNSYRIVTLEGENIAPGGALTGGSSQSKFTNILGRKRQIEELGEKIVETKSEIVKTSNEFEALKSSAKELDEEILNDRDLIHAKTIEITKYESELASLKNETKRLKGNLEVSKNELTRNKKEIEKLNSILEAKNKELESLQGEDVINKEQESELEKSQFQYKNNIEEVNNRVTELKIEKAAFDESLTSKSGEMLRCVNEIEEYEYKKKDIEQENVESQKSIADFEENIKINEENIKISKKLIIELEESFKVEEVNKARFKDELNQKETSINEMTIVISKEESDYNKSEIEKTKKVMERDALYTKLNEEMNLTLAEAKDIAVLVEEPQKYKEAVASLKGRITALGTVNLASIEEYEEVREKYEFMYVQEQDLEKAKKELLDVISELTENMKKLFKENFKILNKNFNETFRELFKGGSAELILGEGDELTATIDINVEPPGKKLQNINLMSGGEKVLSAIALMFAILKMKPTPFCILDEIEAALDDANVFRYAEFLREFSKGTQFIVITHRKGTMEASDVMYGVTMEEKGVSKVVSVDLTKNL